MEIDYNQGFKLARKNFKMLVKSAHHASFIKSYGLACTLNILACEEMIKAFFFHIQALNPGVKIKNFGEVFRNHKIKHQELKSLLESSHAEIYNLSFAILHDKEEFLKVVPSHRLAEFEKEYKDIEKVQRRTEKIRKSKITIGEIFEWLDQAHHEKNLGLYVGLHNTIWQSPKDFKKQKYNLEHAYTDILDKYLNNAIDITKFMKELREREPF